MRTYFNDQRYIAEQLIDMDAHLCMLAGLAHQKIRTLMLSYTVPAYQSSHEALYELVKRSFFYYVTGDCILKRDKPSIFHSN